MAQVHLETDTDTGCHLCQVYFEASTDKDFFIKQAVGWEPYEKSDPERGYSGREITITYRYVHLSCAMKELNKREKEEGYFS